MRGGLQYYIAYSCEAYRTELLLVSCSHANDENAHPLPSPSNPTQILVDPKTYQAQTFGPREFARQYVFITFQVRRGATCVYMRGLALAC